MINLIEVTENNTLQIRDINDVEGITSFSRRTTNSEQDLSGECEMVQSIAALFPLKDRDHPEGAHTDISLIKCACNDPTKFVYQPVKHVVKDGETIASQKEPMIQVDALTDISTLPEKVATFAGYLFTAEAKAAFVDTLPVEEIPQTEMVQDVHKVAVMEVVVTPAVTETRTIEAVTEEVEQEDGSFLTVEVSPATEETVEVSPETTESVAVTKTVKRTVEARESIEIVDGNAVKVLIPASEEDYEEPQYDEYPLVADGKPVMKEIPLLDKNGVQVVVEKVRYNGALYLKSELLA